MRQPPSLILLIFIAMASPLALNAFVPAMPDAAQALHADIGTIQLTFTAYLLTLAFGQLISGPLADFFGRRPILLTGLGLHVAGSLLAAQATGVEWLIAGRVLQALGGSTAMVLARTIILDVHGRAGAAGRMGYVVMAIAIAQSIAPTLGGYLNLWSGWQSVFYVSIVMGALVWLFALIQLPETCTERSPNLRLGSLVGRYGEVLQSGQYLGYAVSTTAIASAFYLFVGSSPYLVVDQLQGDSADFGLWFLAVSLAFMLGSFSSTQLARHFSIDQMVLLGNVLSLIGAAILLLFALSGALTFASLFLPMALVTFGRGLSQPNAQSAAISCATGSAGTASGLMGFIQLLTGAAIAQLVPWLLELGITTLFSCILLAPCIALLAHWQAWRAGRLTTDSASTPQS